MAKSVRPWITSYICEHDHRYGYDLSQACQTPRLCQIVEFTTFRTAADPQAQVTAIISDATHTIVAAFDVAATSASEAPRAGQTSERLTSHLRSVLRLTSYRLRLRPPGTNCLAPRLELDILGWELVGGDRHDPVFASQAVPIGVGQNPADLQVQDVLRKWWSGESKSQLESTADPAGRPSQPTQNMTRETTRTSRSTSNVASTEQEDTIYDARRLVSFNDFLQPLLDESKKLPGWIFRSPPPAQKAELDKIEMFGLDIYPSDEEESKEAKIGPQSLSNGHVVSQQHQQSPSQAAQSQRASSQQIGTSRRPLRVPDQRSSPQPTGETDESDLSDYERQKRKQPKPTATAAESPKVAAKGVVPTPEKESLSQSQDSAPFGLEQYAQSLPAPQASQISVQQVSSSAPQPHSRAGVLVSTTEESAEIAMEGSHGTKQVAQQSPHLRESNSLSLRLALPKRPRTSGDTTGGAHADDEASAPKKRKRDISSTMVRPSQVLRPPSQSHEKTRARESGASSRSQSPEEPSATFAHRRAMVESPPHTRREIKRAEIPSGPKLGHTLDLTPDDFLSLGFVSRALENIQKVREQQRLKSKSK